MSNYNVSTRKMKRCLYCNKQMPNAHPNKKFCSNKHRYKYHNLTNPRGHFAHLQEVEQTSIEDSMHPLDPYSLGQE